MNFEPLEKIANAVLFEGFMLYPYRRTSSAGTSERWGQWAAQTAPACRLNA